MAMFFLAVLVENKLSCHSNAISAHHLVIDIPRDVEPKVMQKSRQAIRDFRDTGDDCIFVQAWFY